MIFEYDNNLLDLKSILKKFFVNVSYMFYELC